jgi:hypothetical protein
LRQRHANQREVALGFWVLGSKSSAGIIFPNLTQSLGAVQPGASSFAGLVTEEAPVESTISGASSFRTVGFGSALFPFVSNRACGARPELLQFGDLIDRKFPRPKAWNSNWD